jgi:hypothetical protein
MGRMSGKPILLPTPEAIAARIAACRAEMLALRKLHRLAKTAQAVEEAFSRRQTVSSPPDLSKGEQE